MSAGASPMEAHWAAGRCTARDRGRSEEGPLARAVLAPVPSSPRAPEPPWALPSHGARRRRAGLRSGRAWFVGSSSSLGSSAFQNRDATEDAKPEARRRRRERARKGAAFGSGRRGGRAPLFTGRAGGGPRPSPSRRVKPRRVASLRPRAAYGPRRTAVARKPSPAWPDAVPLCPSRLRREGAPLRPPGPQAARPPNKLRRPRRRRKAAKARSQRRAFASTKAWPRRPRARRRPSCQAALRAPMARALKAWHGAMPSR